MELFGILMLLLPLSMACRRREEPNELPGEWMLRRHDKRK
ncbi:hypothetical protein b3_0054 [Synechococcus phage B3]|nr:hypothetical protein b3_0054 [Synechococcus phage B3]QGT54679.1 hypothetical protein b23_0054 [Synechococcus phage B23]